MASTERGHDPAPGKRGYETRDVNVKVAAILAGAIALLIPVTLYGMNLLFDHFAAREARNQPRSRTLIPKETNPLPPAPRLQDNPLADLKEHRAEEAAKANGYMWLDQKADRVRIPVSRAMELTLERGLPSRAAGAASRSAAQPATSAAGRGSLSPSASAAPAPSHEGKEGTKP